MTSPTTLLLPVALSLYAIVALAERVPQLRFKPSPFLRPFFATDVLWYLSTSGVVLATRPYLLDLPVSPLAGPLAALPLPLATLAAVLVYDFTAFVIHVVLHRSNVLWEIHKIHHSTRTLDWLATTRQHAIEGLLRNVSSQAVLFLLGFPMAAIVGTLLTYVAFAAMGHSNLRINLRWAEPIFVTPRIHRLHHIPETTQNNFATIFTFWDRLFGLFVVRDATEDEVLGVPEETDTYPQTFVSAFAEPIRRILGRGRCSDQPLGRASSTGGQS